MYELQALRLKRPKSHERIVVRATMSIQPEAKAKGNADETMDFGGCGVPDWRVGCERGVRHHPRHPEQGARSRQ
jgi:hypothetical protein